MSYNGLDVMNYICEWYNLPPVNLREKSILVRPMRSIYMVTIPIPSITVRTCCRNVNDTSARNNNIIKKRKKKQQQQQQLQHAILKLNIQFCSFGHIS